MTSAKEKMATDTDACDMATDACDVATDLGVIATEAEIDMEDHTNILKALNEFDDEQLYDIDNEKLFADANDLESRNMESNA